MCTSYRSKAPQHSLPTLLPLSQLQWHHLMWWVLYWIHYSSQLFRYKHWLSYWLSTTQCFANWMICIDDDDADDFIIITSSNYLCSTSPHLNLTLYFFYHLSRYNSLIYSIFVVILIVETLYSYSMLVLMFMFIHLLLNPPVNLWLFVSSSLFKVIIIIIIIIINHLIC